MLIGHDRKHPESRLVIASTFLGGGRRAETKNNKLACFNHTILISHDLRDCSAFIYLVHYCLRAHGLGVVAAAADDDYVASVWICRRRRHLPPAAVAAAGAWVRVRPWLR